MPSRSPTRTTTMASIAATCVSISMSASTLPLTVWTVGVGRSLGDAGVVLAVILAPRE